MKFAIPTENNKLCPHFGKCNLFTFIEADENSGKIISKEIITPSGQCHEYMSGWMTENKVDVVIAGGMGLPAQEMVREQGIKVIAGAPSEDPEKLVLDYLSGNLTTGSISCNCTCNH